MHKNLYAGIIFVFLAAAGVLYGASYSEDDISRLLYLRKPVGNNLTSHFLVLKRIGLDRRTLHCRIYGTTRNHSVDISAVTKLPFYENSSAFMITQYALYNILRNASPNPALLLAQLDREAAARVSPIIKFQMETEKLRKEISAVLRDTDSDQDDRNDKIIDILENSPIFTLPSSAAASGDWITAITLCEKLAEFLKSGSMWRILIHKELRSTTNDLFNKCVQNLLDDLAVKFSTPNARQELFSKYFPRARGIWSEGAPSDYKTLRRLFYASLEAYFKLDNISRLASPQDWGSAMLDVLILTEGCPTSGSLEQEFDTEMRVWAKRTASDKSGI